MDSSLLIIDDDKEILQLVAKVCQRGLPDLRIRTAATGEEGLRLAEQEKPGVVVLDVRLPDMDGFEVCRRLRAHPATAGTRVLMLSGVLTEQDNRLEGLRSGADGYLCKPFQPEELLAQLNILYRWRAFELSNQQRLEELVAQRTRALNETNERLRQEIAERRQLENQLLQARKLEVVGQLAAGVAHEFNNSLQVVLGFTEILIADTDAQHPHSHDLREIQHAAERAAAVTQQLLAFSQKQMIQPVPLNLNAIIGQSQTLLKRLLGEDIEICTHLARDLRLVKADVAQVEQIVMNLAVNARDAMPQGGRLTISTDNVVFDDEDADAIPDGHAGPFVRLAITDTGVGMAPEVLAHLFEPFFSTKGPGKGTGLGLSVIYGIVKQHHGWVNVYSEPGQGATFKCYLPVYSSEEEAAPTQPEATALPPAGSGERILLLEDEPDVRLLAERILRQAGYEVCAAASVREGRQLFEREAGRFDLFFSDVVLPDGNGIELAEALLAQAPGLPVLLCSGYTDERARWGDIEAHGFQFLQKPYPKAALLQVIRRLLNAGTLTAPS